jgi:hypothetical protein
MNAKMPYIGSAKSQFYDKILEDYVHDGDTMNIVPSGTFGVRYLGADTAEVTSDYPSGLRPVGVGESDGWPRVTEHQKYLEDPFSVPDSAQFKGSLGKGLFDYLQEKLSKETAVNHQRHADIALAEIKSMIKNDIIEYTSQEPKPRFEFSFFLAFAYEVMDRYGRFLCYIDKRKSTQERERDPLTYNEKMLQKGLAAPYFIWPNTDPFRKETKDIQSLSDAIYPANKFYEEINADNRLTDARNSVRAARKDEIGIYSREKDGPLKLQSFELRYLFRRKPPERFVIDMSASDTSPILLRPTEYYTIPHEEDRLFVDVNYIHLFKSKGYRIQPDAIQ